MKFSALVGAAMQLATLAVAGPVDVKASDANTFLIYGVRPRPPSSPSTHPAVPSQT